jgi:hypothetical protein
MIFYNFQRFLYFSIAPIGRLCSVTMMGSGARWVVPPQFPMYKHYTAKQRKRSLFVEGEGKHHHPSVRGWMCVLGAKGRGESERVY